MALIEVRLRPTTPWRVGHGGGDRERVDVVYHSDSLFSAITLAMKTLGWLDEWLAATAQSTAGPLVRFSSLFPFIGRTRLIAPPRTWWPPANPGRLYTEAAKLIPLEVIRNGIADESRWMVDGETGCMFHTGSGTPVKIEVRAAAAVDRLTGVADPHRIACLEFAPNAGYWGVFAASDSQWESRVKSAFRLLADSGFGGERSRGWGRAAAPEFSDASSLLPAGAGDEGAWWLLSLYSPNTTDAIDWTRGEYAATQRGGWTDSHSGVAPKKQVRMLEEGSVLFAPSLLGRAIDVAPEGFPHPAYRSGFALAIPAPPEPVMRQPQAPVEPQTESPAVSEPIEQPNAEPETNLPSRDGHSSSSKGAVAEQPEPGPGSSGQEAAESEPQATPASNEQAAPEPETNLPVAEQSEPGPAPSVQGSPDPVRFEQPVPEPGREPEFESGPTTAPAGSSDIEQETPAHPADTETDTETETDTQGTSTHEDLP